jgi:hypothetical protein
MIDLPYVIHEFRRLDGEWVRRRVYYAMEAAEFFAWIGTLDPSRNQFT